jgi:hypothetical protein
MVACGAAAPVSSAATVRFVDDAPFADVHAKCGGKELVLYRHDEGGVTIGGNGDDGHVRALVETLAVHRDARVLRSDWRCGILGGGSFRELRCVP